MSSYSLYENTQIERLISKIDSDRFGFMVAKLTPDISDVKTIIESLKKKSVRLVIARVPLTNVPLINKLEVEGFQYKDSQLTYNYCLDRILPDRDCKELIITDYMPAHYDQIMSLTEKSFSNYGHYFADDRIDKSKCRLIYMDWIDRCCTSKHVSDFFLVAEYNSKVAGYLALKTENEVEGNFGRGVIGAVSPDFRGKGVFKEINIESLHRGRTMGLTRVENNVLTTNYPVIRTYSSLSYYVIASSITMHCWL